MWAEYPIAEGRSINRLRPLTSICATLVAVWAATNSRIDWLAYQRRPAGEMNRPHSAHMHFNIELELRYIGPGHDNGEAMGFSSLSRSSMSPCATWTYAQSATTN